MVVDFRTAQTSAPTPRPGAHLWSLFINHVGRCAVEKLKKDLDAEWRRAEQLSCAVINFEEKRQAHETEKSRLREENQALVSQTFGHVVADVALWWFLIIF